MLGFMSVGLFCGCLVSIALADALPIGVRLPLAMIVGGLVAAVFGLLIGLPALRLKGDYLAIVTLACGEIIKNIITNLDITGGALGLSMSAVYAKPRVLLPFAACPGAADHHCDDEPKEVQIRAEPLWPSGITASRRSPRASMSRTIKLAVFIIAAFFAGAAGVALRAQLRQCQGGVL